MQQLIVWIEANLDRRIPLEKMTCFMDVSHTCLHDVFKAETGLPPHCYLHQLRMERARKLLETSPLTIEQVMARVGIKNRSHFDRAFKKRYGLRPAKYKAGVRLVKAARMR